MSLLLPLLTSSSSISALEKQLCWAIVCNPLRAVTCFQLLLSMGCLSAANLTHSENVGTQPDIYHRRSGAIKCYFVSYQVSAPRQNTLIPIGVQYIGFQMLFFLIIYLLGNFFLIYLCIYYYAHFLFFFFFLKKTCSN